MSNTRTLLIAQMKRALELMENMEVKELKEPDFSPYFYEHIAELENKLHEIRRDSIRFAKEVRSWTY